MQTQCNGEFCSCLEQASVRRLISKQCHLEYSVLSLCEGILTVVRDELQKEHQLLDNLSNILCCEGIFVSKVVRASLAMDYPNNRSLHELRSWSLRHV